MSLTVQETKNKWKAILEHADLPKLDKHRYGVIASLMENTEKELGTNHSMGSSLGLLGESTPTNIMGNSSSTQGSGAIDTFDPVLISLIRRAMPNLMAYDVAGVQAMNGPTGLIFAMRSRYTNQTGPEAFYNEANTSSSTLPGNTVNLPGYGQVGTLPGSNTVQTGLATANVYNYGTGMSRTQGEALGTTGGQPFAEMAMSIEKVSVTAVTRALKASYTMEIAQDLKAIHGLEIEGELSNMLSTEILAEINRELIRTINVTATPGAQVDVTTPGVFDLDTDSNGRWSVEKFKGLMFQLERDANAIAKATRRGKGNILICSSDVASALSMAGILDYTPALNSNNLQVDDTGNTFAGVLNNRMKVYIDPYALGGNYATVGYKGPNNFDAGIFYCPYVPLQMVRAVDPLSFDPAIGFKTRYGMVSNPYAGGINQNLGALTQDSNVYYRRVIISNLS